MKWKRVKLNVLPDNFWDGWVFERKLVYHPITLLLPMCKLPPPGWVCTRGEGHSGPCAAWPDDAAELERLFPDVDPKKKLEEEACKRESQR